MRLLALLVVTLAACRDPSAGPAPRNLDARQKQIVSSRRLDTAPAPTLVPVGGPVTLGDGAVRYLGADVSPKAVVRGERFELTHYWQSLKPLRLDYKVFVHLSRPDDEKVALNADHIPVDSLWPTSRWKPGEIYADLHQATLPTHWTGDSLAIFVGLYWFDDRLAVDRRSAHDGADRIALPRVPVRSGELPVPEYRVQRAPRPPQIDGRTDEPWWRTMPVITLMRSDGRGRPSLATEVRMAWDDEFLYLVFRADDPDAWSSFENDDDPLYQQEVVEVFIDADGDGRTYNEMQVAPTGRRFDARFEGPRQGMDLSWHSGMRTAVVVDGTVNDDTDRDRGWTVEMAIPHTSLYAVPNTPPKRGDVWRVNLFRLEHHDRKRVEGSAWSPPVVPDFHRVERFGRLIFE